MEETHNLETYKTGRVDWEMVALLSNLRPIVPSSRDSFKLEKCQWTNPCRSTPGFYAYDELMNRQEFGKLIAFLLFAIRITFI